MNGLRSEIVDDLNVVFERVPGLSDERRQEATAAAATYPFRTTRFYVERVLNGRPDDPLLDVILPSAEEFDPFEETWDTNQFLEPAVDSPLWSQKYSQEGLIRLTTYCSALCRYCYVRQQTNQRVPADHRELERIFDQLSQPRANELREIILSGGDPLATKPNVLVRVGELLAACNRRRTGAGMHAVQLTVHTREPVWRPREFLDKWQDYAKAFSVLGAYAYVFQVIHPREVTPEFQEVVSRIARCGNRQSLLLVQHPLFRGINSDPDVLVELYDKLAQGDAPMKPYYIVHPFDSGTMARHRLKLPESQRIVQELFRRMPGILMPTLVVPMTKGKAYVSPYEKLVEGPMPGHYRLTTKTGEVVDYIDLAEETQFGSLMPELQILH